MPIFDYYCSECEVLTERLVSSGDIDNQHCSECDHILFRRVSAPKGLVKDSQTPVSGQFRPRR